MSENPKYGISEVVLICLCACDVYIHLLTFRAPLSVDYFTPFYLALDKLVSETGLRCI